MNYNNWAVTDFENDKLIEIIDGDRGKNYPNGDDFNKIGFCLFLNTKNVTKNGFDFSECMFITRHKDQLLRKGKLVYDDVVLTTRGTVGNVAYYRSSIPYKNMRINSGMVILRSNQKLLIPMYLYYILKNPSTQNKINQFATGSAQPQLPIATIKKIDFKLPNINIQKSITDILSSLDDKIELNSKINKNLEKLAQNLYKRWFVDFEFPNKDGEPYKSSGGEMVESELGLIPKGWEYKPIQSIVDTVLGGTPSRKISDYWGPGYEWLKSGELNNFRIIKGTETITQKGLDSSATKLMPKGTVLIGITGYVGLVSMLEIEACANQSVVGIIPNNLFPRTFLYGLIKSEIGDIASKQTGSAQQHINKNDINTHRVLIPTNQLITKFHSILEPIHQKISNNIFENEKLSIIRDELLPKLMSGEIEVPAGEDNGA
jgi:type I restriction enzyme S subunit